MNIDSITTSSIRPELIDGQNMTEAVHIVFKNEIDKFEKFLTLCSDKTINSNQLGIALVLGAQTLEFLKAVYLLQVSTLEFPSHALLRSAFESTFRLAYLARDDGSSVRYKQLYKEAIKAEKDEHNDWTTAGYCTDDFHKNRVIELENEEFLYKSIPDLPKMDQIVRLVVQNKHKKETNKKTAEWYVLFRHFSGSVHGRVIALGKSYLNDDLSLREKYKFNPEVGRSVELDTFAINLLNIAGNSLTIIFKL